MRINAFELYHPARGIRAFYYDCADLLLGAAPNSKQFPKTNICDRTDMHVDSHAPLVSRARKALMWWLVDAGKSTNLKLMVVLVLLGE